MRRRMLELAASARADVEPLGGDGADDGSDAEDFGEEKKTSESRLFVSSGGGGVG